MPKGGYRDDQIMQSNYAGILKEPAKLGYRVSREHLQWCYEQITTLRSLLDAERQNHDAARTDAARRLKIIDDLVNYGEDHNWGAMPVGEIIEAAIDEGGLGSL